MDDFFPDCPECGHLWGGHLPTCPTLTPRAYARSSDPDTSHEAANQCDVNKSEQTVLECVRAAGAHGVIASEVCSRTGLAWNTASPRFKPLRKKNLIDDSGERRVGPYGRRQIVWKVR